MAFDMESLLRRDRVALLLSEVQRSVIGDQAKFLALTQSAREVGVIPNCARLADAARAQGAPVVHCLANTAPGRFGANTNARLFAGAEKLRAGDHPHDPMGDTPCPEVWREGDVLSPRDHG